jgi:hypothetical protein
MGGWRIKRRHGSDLYRVVLYDGGGNPMYVGAIVAPISELLERKLLRNPKSAFPIYGDHWCAVYNDDVKSYGIYDSKEDALNAALAVLQ